MHDEPLYFLKVTVWYNLYGGWYNVYGVSNIVTMTSERYKTMINDLLLPQIHKLGLEDMWFQRRE